MKSWFLWFGTSRSPNSLEWSRRREGANLVASLDRAVSRLWGESESEEARQIYIMFSSVRWQIAVRLEIWGPAEHIENRRYIMSLTLCLWGVLVAAVKADVRQVGVTADLSCRAARYRFRHILETNEHWVRDTAKFEYYASNHPLHSLRNQPTTRPLRRLVRHTLYSSRMVVPLFD